MFSLGLVGVVVVTSDIHMLWFIAGVKKLNRKTGVHKSKLSISKSKKHNNNCTSQYSYTVHSYRVLFSVANAF